METLDSRIYSAGKTDIPSVVIPPTIKLVRFHFDRTALSDPNALFDFQVECSFDNGRTWRPWMGCGFPGGPSLDRDGKEAPSTTLTTTADIPVAWDKVGNATEWVRPTHARSSLICGKGSQETSCKVEFI